MHHQDILLICCYLAFATTFSTSYAGRGLTEKLKKKPECITLRDAFYNVIHDYVITYLYDVPDDEAHASERAQIKSNLHAVIGIDVDDLDQIQNVACQLIGISTVQQLSDILGVPYRDLSHVYNIAVSMIHSTQGGVRSYVMNYDISVRMGTFFRDTRFPRWPLGVTLQVATNFTYDLVDDYGTTFLSGFDPWDYGSEVNPRSLSRAFVKSKSAKQFQKKSRISVPTATALMELADRAVHMDQQDWLTFSRGGMACIHFLQITSRLGLLDLRLDSINLSPIP